MGAKEDKYISDIMKVSKKLKISSLVVRPDNIIEIARKLYKEYEDDNESDDKEINFILKGIDGTQYESEDIKIFSEDGILDTRRILAVEMAYYNYTEKKKISISLKHSVKEYIWGNYVSVSGYDELWVKGMIKDFEDTIANWEKQENWPHKYGWFLTIIFAIGIGLLILDFSNLIFTYVVGVHSISPKPKWAIELRPLFIFYYYAFGILLGYWPASYIVDKLKELYPIVELRTGPEYIQVEAKKRKRLYTIISMGIIPLIISLIIELIMKIR